MASGHQGTAALVSGCACHTRGDNHINDPGHAIRAHPSLRQDVPISAAALAGGVWIEIARNTPVLFQIFFYWGLGEFGLFLSSFTAVVTALTFNTAGYMAETFRGGFNAMESTQVRAARSLGMTAFQTQLRIVIPQVFRAIYYPMTNQFHWVLLMSSLGMLAGLRELAGETQFFNSRTFRTFEFFTAAAIIYFLLAKIIMLLARIVGWRLFRVQVQR